MLYFSNVIRAVAMALTITTTTSLLNPERSEAFTLMETNLRGWNQHPLRFRVDATDCSISEADLLATLARALELWNGVPTSRLEVSLGDPVDLANADNSVYTDPVIYCAPDCSAQAGTDCNYLPAFTELATRDQTITYGRITLNAEPDKVAEVSRIFQSDPDKLAMILAHEIGHVLGLGHATESSALMYFDITDRNYLSLSIDDEVGVTYLYPRNEPGGGAAFGCGTLANSSDGSAGTGNGLGTLLFGIGLLYLGRKILRRGHDRPDSTPIFDH